MRWDDGPRWQSGPPPRTDPRCPGCRGRSLDLRVSWATALRRPGRRRMGSTLGDSTCTVEDAAPDPRRTSRDRLGPLLDVPERYEPKGTLMHGTIRKRGKKWHAVADDGPNPTSTAKVGPDRDWPRRRREGARRRAQAQPPRWDRGGRDAAVRRVPDGSVASDPGGVAAQEHPRCQSTHVGLHVIAALSKRPPDQLSPEDIDLFYAALLRAGRKKHPGEKGGTARPVSQVGAPHAGGAEKSPG